MRKVIFILLFLCEISCAQDKNVLNYRYLQGTWLGVLEDGYDYECPDAIGFISQNEYVIYNDCEGLDIVNPVVEKGKYKIKKDGIIVLYDRQFMLHNYFFLESFGKEKSILFKVKELKKEKLILHFSREKESTVKLYFKRV